MIIYKTKLAGKWELSKAGLSIHTYSMDIDKLIGRNLRRLRESRGISQDKLAIMINTPATRLSAYETGREGMGKDIMMRVCNALEVKLYEFYIEPDTPLPASDLEKKAIYIVREAEKLGVAYIAEEAAEYTAHRLDVVKKQAKKGIRESKPSRLKTGSG